MTRDRSAPLDRWRFLAVECPQAGDMAQRLAEEGVQIDARGRYFRLGPAPYLSDAQLHEAMNRLGSAAAALGLRWGILAAMTETKITLPERAIRSAGTTSGRHAEPAAAGAPPRHRRAVGRTTSPPSSRWTSFSRRSRRTRRYPFRTRSATSTASGDRRRSTAHRLEAALGTRSRIFYKYEG